MAKTLHSLLEQWEDYLGNHPDADVQDFLEHIDADADFDTVNRFQVALQRLKWIDRWLKQIGVDDHQADRSQHRV